MRLDVTFQETKQNFTPRFGAVHNVSDGGFDRGYAAGYEQGETEGYAKGHTDGQTDGIENLFLKTIKSFSSDKVVSVEQYTFYGCAQLEELDMPNLASVPGSMCFKCEKLKKVILPRLTGGVGVSAFQHCRELEYADVGGATSIAAAAFFDCQSLSTLIIRNSSVVTVGGNTFAGNSGIAKKTGFVYVPDHLVDSYKTAANWSTYATQIKPISELEGD